MKSNNRSETDNITTPVANGWALLPILIFLVVYLGNGIFFECIRPIEGAMFGDNLSFISYTTIAATKTQGVQMADKFRTNIKIALPSAILTLLVILFLSLNSEAAPMGNFDFDPIFAAPYFAVLILALLPEDIKEGNKLKYEMLEYIIE